MTPTGAERILRERKRQRSQEGWSLEHDDHHRNGELAAAAICYAAPRPIYQRGQSTDKAVSFVSPWPWTDRIKTTSRIRDLEKAGALIAAEIDRLLRVEQENSL